MLSDFTINRIKSVQTKEEYNEMMDRFMTSDQPLNIREEAMDELKKQKPHFDTTVKYPTEEVAKMMKECESDTSDMGTGYN